MQIRFFSFLLFFTVFAFPAFTLADVCMNNTVYQIPDRSIITIHRPVNIPPRTQWVGIANKDGHDCGISVDPAVHDRLIKPGTTFTVTTAWGGSAGQSQCSVEARIIANCGSSGSRITLTCSVPCRRHVSIKEFQELFDGLFSLQIAGPVAF